MKNIKWFTNNLKYDLALSTILILIVVVVVQHLDLKFPETVIAYEKVEVTEEDKFKALWKEETAKVYAEMYQEAEIRALTNISTRVGEEADSYYSKL